MDRNETRRNLVARKRLMVAGDKAERGCECLTCASNFPHDPDVLQYDHLNQGSKSANVADLVEDNASWAKIENEMALCRVICANCHMKHSKAQRRS